MTSRPASAMPPGDDTADDTAVADRARSLPARIAPWLLVILTALLVVSLTPRSGLDLSVYREGGRALLDPQADLYAPILGPVGDPGLPFTYPPFAALLFTSLTLVPLPVSLGLLTVATAVLLHLVSRDLTARLRRALPWWRLPAWALTLAGLLAMPGRETLTYGQINVLLMSAVYLALASRRHPWAWFAVAVGVTAGIKITPLALLLLPLMLGRIRTCVLAGLAFLGTQAIGFLATPEASVRFWTSVLWDPSRVGGIDYIDNASLRGALTRVTEAATPLWMVGVLAVIGLVAVLIRRERGQDRIVLLGLTSAVPLLISPISWVHHFVWWPVFLYAVLAVTSGARSRALRIAAVTVAGLTLAALAYTPKHLANAFGDGWINAATGAAIPVGMLVLLGLTLAASLARRNADDAAPEVRSAR